MFHVFSFPFMLKQLLFLALLTEFALTLSDFPFFCFSEGKYLEALSFCLFNVEQVLLFFYFFFLVPLRLITYSIM